MPQLVSNNAGYFIILFRQFDQLIKNNDIATGQRYVAIGYGEACPKPPPREKNAPRRIRLKAKPKAEPKEPALTTFLKEANAIAKAPKHKNNL